MKKFWILTAVAFLVVLGYSYLYKDHQNIEVEAAEISLSAQQIHSELSHEPLTSINTYENKVIEIYGFVSEISETAITIDDRVLCQFSKLISQQEIALHSKVTIKGRFIGYDNLLEKVRLDQCIIN